MRANVFPGQGSQVPGMGKNLYEISLDAKLMFEKANKILNWNPKVNIENGLKNVYNFIKYNQTRYFSIK